MEEAVRLSLSEYDKISGVGFLYQTSVADTFPLHNHDFYEIFYVLSGKAVHRINGFDEMLNAGTFEFLRPDDTHRYSFFNRYDMELISVGIEKDLAEEIAAFVNIPTSKMFEGAMPKKTFFMGTRETEITKLILAIGKKRAGSERRNYARSIIPMLLYELYESASDENRFIPEWLNSVILKMSERDNFIEGLPKMLEIANVTQEHLNREFKKHLRITPTEFINMKRVEYAVSLLNNGIYSVAEISGMCGFSTLSNFYLNFEKYNHIPPKKFLKRSSENEIGQ